MREVVVIGARRSPIGRFGGKLASLPAVELATRVGQAVLSDIPRDCIDLVVLGNVLTSGQGMNPARQIALRLDVPQSTPAFTVNMMCASGLQSILLAAQAIQTGTARCVLCGGAESMSQAPLLHSRARQAYAFGDVTLSDSILKDGLVDPGSQWHMGRTAETLARKFQISRAEQDAYAVLSQQRAAAAVQNPAEQAALVAMDELTADEHPRPDTNLERLARLRPAFEADGTVTAGNSSGINDGAAWLVLADAEWAHAEGFVPLARYEAGFACGCDPAEMGLGPVHALRRLELMTGTPLAESDALEINEAFAAQTLACLRELKLSPERINVHGGAIAVGHPIGMSGARLAVQLVQRLAQGEITRGLAALCVGGGMGIAAAFRRCV